ncbi:MAG: anaerobic ribonucleoside-triphosphate reductase activating protein [Stomatobaculum sp.]|nr:anaerobic ribonucleoside-triphosphate reductase activating protein [Stomatobaculum sp.]
MKIYGLQKMTLLDFPGKVACTVFLGGCDFRCPWCHNFELVVGSTEPMMDEEEFFSFLKKRKGLLDGVAITGGEPCLYRDLPVFLRKIRELGFLTKLDTNGVHPELLEQLLREGLADYVAMDIKNSPEKYPATAGLDLNAAGREALLGLIRRSIGLIMELAPDYEFRTTVIREFHEEQDFEGIGGMIRGAKRYFLQSFTDRETVPCEGLGAPEPEELKKYAETIRPFVTDVQIRGME